MRGVDAQEPDYIREPALAACEGEAQFWQRMTELGVPEGQAWETLRVVLAEIQGGANYTDPWEVTVDRLADVSR